MTPTDFYTLNLSLIDQYNSTFEYWLSITFAYVVAFFFISKEKEIESRLQYFLILLYTLTSAIFIVRFALRTGAVGTLHDTMATNEIPMPPWNDGGVAGDIVLVGMFWVMVLGSIGALYFSISRIRRDSDT